MNRAEAKGPPLPWDVPQQLPRRWLSPPSRAGCRRRRYAAYPNGSNPATVRQGGVDSRGTTWRPAKRPAGRDSGEAPATPSTSPTPWINRFSAGHLGGAYMPGLAERVSLPEAAGSCRKLPELPELPVK